MRRLPSADELRRSPIRVGVALVVGIATVAVLATYVSTLRDAGAEAARSSALSFADREVAGGNEVVADQEAVYQARARIPERATFHVAVGPEYAGGSDLTVPFVESYYTYFLMPRRPADDAPWVICYGCDLGQYGARANVLWRSDEGISIVRLRG